MQSLQPSCTLRNLTCKNGSSFAGMVNIMDRIFVVVVPESAFAGNAQSSPGNRLSWPATAIPRWPVSRPSMRVWKAAWEPPKRRLNWDMLLTLAAMSGISLVGWVGFGMLISLLVK